MLGNSKINVRRILTEIGSRDLSTIFGNSEILRGFLGRSQLKKVGLHNGKCVNEGGLTPYRLLRLFFGGRGVCFWVVILIEI